jgi:drug/metabolite transporter (DMT)-like permease
MRPLSSPVRDHRVLGRVQVIIGALFLVFGGTLSPIEAAIGLVIAMPLMAAVMYLAVFRPVSRRLLRNPPPAPTTEREDPGSFARRMRWPVAGQVALFLVLAAVGHAPGLVGGIALGLGVALLLTARLLERWENEHEVGLLYEPGGGRRQRGGYYVARGR